MQSYVKRTAANRSDCHSALSRHAFVMLDLALSLVQVVVENKIALGVGQMIETVTKAVMLLGCVEGRIDSYVDVSSGDLFPSRALADYVPRDAVKVTRRFASVPFFNFGQAKYDAIDRFIRKIFCIVQAFGDKNPHKSGVDGFVFPTCNLSIRIQPNQQ